jgi:hypothetical protein
LKRLESGQGEARGSRWAGRGWTEKDRGSTLGTQGRKAMAIDEALRRRVLTYQKNVLTEHQIYRRRLLEMTVVSLGVAGLSFGVGYLIRVLLGVEV